VDARDSVLEMVSNLDMVVDVWWVVKVMVEEEEGRGEGEGVRTGEEVDEEG